MLSPFSRTLPAVAAVSVAFLAASCSTTPAESNNESQSSPSSQSTEAAVVEAPIFPVGQKIDLKDRGIEDRHPNGVKMEVTSITLQETGIVLGVEVVNGNTSPAKMNMFDSWLIDDTGAVFRLRKPENDDTKMEVAPGEALTGEWTFLGKPELDASTLTLKVNAITPDHVIDKTERSPHMPSPAMLIENIPMK